MLRAVRSSERPSFLVHSPLPSPSMRTLPPAFWSRPQAAITKASFVATHQISSTRSEEHTSELQSPDHLVCRLLLEKKKHQRTHRTIYSIRRGLRPVCHL